MKNNAKIKIFLCKQDMASKDYRNEPICVYEQESEVYLRLAGFLERPIGETGDQELTYLSINRNYYLSASDNVLILRQANIPGAPEYRFSSALIVLQPDVRPCQRRNDCKQIVRYFEQSAYVDIGELQTYQLQVCDLIAANDNLLYYINGYFNECNCDQYAIGERVGQVSRLKSSERLSFPSAAEFFIHLRNPIPSPA